jgi:dihydrofolate synthase/folylpolyglutamate synthase
MTFEGAQEYLLGLIDETRSRREQSLDRMRALLRALGDPQNAYPTVHVGGTSGKGSTATMIAAVLTAAGHRTGLHVKPHLQSVTERASIDATAIPPERFVALLEEMMPAIEQTTAAHGAPSYYETLLALAFTYFAREAVDVAVIEVGLGGRLDGTNVIIPEVAVITSVGFDHTEVLGETLEAIAAEKAGIVKEGVPLVVGADRPEAIAVIESAAREKHAPLIHVDDASQIAVQVGDERRFEVTTAHAGYDIRLPVFGSFQRRNARTAILALEALPQRLRPAPEAVERGLGRVAIPGRMEVFAGTPTIVLDIAHNAEKAEHLAAALRERFPGRRLRALVAIGESKDASAILDALAPLLDSLFVTSFSAAGRRALEPERLLALAQSLRIPARAIADPVEAFRDACAQSAADDVLVVTGSTFVVAAVRQEAIG